MKNFVPKVGMIFKTLEEAEKFYKYYSKLASFSMKIRNTTRDRDQIKNQLIVCTREERWKSKISPTLKTNSSAGLNCLARIYVHIMKDVGLWTIFKVDLNHSHPCCPDQADMLKQHRELSMFVRRTIETHEEAEIRSSKTYQSFIAAAGSHRELGFIEKNVRNYITRKVWNIFEEDDAKEFGKKYGLGGNKWLLELYEDWHICIPVYLDHHFWVGMRNFHTVIPCTTKSAIKAQFQHVYTHEKFKLNSESKNIKSMHTHIKSSQDEPLLEPRSKRFDELVFRSHNICEFASEFEELTEILHRAFDKVMAEMEEYQERSKGKSLLIHKEATLSNVNDLQSPPRVKTRGRPKNKLGSNLEKKISNAMKKKKKTDPSKIKLTCF
ncbi:hypothetical protein Ahy_A10g049508 [Arachis hypogaea]|uniref:Protein FAR1-RELATED SEQUENCE n=1 Tax=Arachis hypogaea TaxID=3818 RepID=A0A445B7B7_ARAHY|nr:hypothetical protein Ahy_A10g049508 [Arachis hypogaea]